MAQATRWLTAEEQRTWQRFRKMTRSLDARLARELAHEGGLSMQDYDVLSALTDSPDRRCSAKDLGAHLLWTPSRLSHHIDRMQQRGLVRRERHGRGRGIDVVLTADGLDAIRTAAPGHVETVRESLIDLIAAAELVILARISDTILAGLEDRDLNDFSAAAAVSLDA
jgi:DNA-binding MarR family transcriptional regulator